VFKIENYIPFVSFSGLRLTRYQWRYLLWELKCYRNGDC